MKNTPRQNDDKIRFGTVGRAHGVRGAVRIHLENPASEIFGPGLRVSIEGYGDAEIEKVFGGDRVHFIGLTDRNDAEALKGKSIYVERDELPELDDDEYYLADLIGADVFLEDETKVGTLIRFWSNGAQDIGDIETGAGVVAMPFVSQFLVDVQPDEKKVVIAPPGGLFPDTKSGEGETSS